MKVKKFKEVKNRHYHYFVALVYSDGKDSHILNCNTILEGAKMSYKVISEIIEEKSKEFSFKNMAMINFCELECDCD